MTDARAGGSANLVNAHTHLYSGLAPLGLPAPQPAPETFVQILERVWWLLDRALDEDSLRASAELYIAESIGHGTIGLVDHHESPELIEGSLDIIADACSRFGMQALLCYGATERNGGRDEAQRGLAECRRFIESNQRPGIRGLIGLHASFTVSDDTIREAAAMARELDTALHIHVAEAESDVADARSRGYLGVIDRLEKLEAMIPNSIFAHGVYLTRAEVEAVASARCWLVQNPRSNQGNKVGYPAHLAASPLVALGTDGYPADMGAETDALLQAATAANDDLQHARTRAAGGIRLMASWFDQPAATDSEAAAAALPDIRENAEVQAEKLWTRMRSL